MRSEMKSASSGEAKGSRGAASSAPPPAAFRPDSATASFFETKKWTPRRASLMYEPVVESFLSAPDFAAAVDTAETFARRV